VTKIILVRHGYVDRILPERFHGRDDVLLTSQGIEAAWITSRWISATQRVTTVYTSPMIRCLRTAQIIAEPFSLDAQPMDALIDIDYGEWQGLIPDEVRARWPREIDLWYRRPDLVRVPGGETLQDVLARAADALRLVVDRHPEKTVVLVGHDSVNRVSLLHALELPLARYWQLAQSPCAINQIIAARDNHCVRSLNETGHLDESSPRHLDRGDRRPG
jgi:broad specificity phosphatase PhoE